MAINSIQGVRSDISEMLSKMREASQKTQLFNENPTTESTSSSFNDVLSVVKDAVSNVNQAQVKTEQVQNAYTLGDKHISMSQVVVASQQSKLAFEGLLTVRNKILDAYKEIMNMAI